MVAQTDGCPRLTHRSRHTRYTHSFARSTAQEECGSHYPRLAQRAAGRKRITAVAFYARSGAGVDVLSRSCQLRDALVDTV